MPLTKPSLGGNNLYMTSLFPPRDSLVSDILAGERNIKKLFYGVFVGLKVKNAQRKNVRKQKTFIVFLGSSF
jgi:hypothetical protein